MSSNIHVQRICQHCGTEFTARTTTTAYCSHRCNSAAYKQKIRSVKVQKSNAETRQIKTKPIEVLKAKEFLTVTEVSKLIGCLIILSKYTSMKNKVSEKPYHSEVGRSEERRVGKECRSRWVQYH